MGKKMMVWSLLVLGMVMMMFLLANSASSTSSARTPNDITCTEAITKLLPCVPFLKGSAPPTPSFSCCLGAQEVFQRANTTQCRRNLCECFKKAAVDYSVDPARAKLMPELCKIDIPVPLDPKIDCKTISF